MSVTSTTTAAPTAAEVHTWQVDAAHSTVEFSVRHMVISTFTGRFTSFEGTVSFNEAQPEASSVVATVDVESIQTGNTQREDHLRSDDFFNAETYPTMTFRSTSIERDGEDYKIRGDLTIRDITRPVVFEAEYGGIVKDPWGNLRAGFVAETTINRRDFGLNWSAVIETGGAVVADKVKIKLHIEAVRQA